MAEEVLGEPRRCHMAESHLCSLAMLGFQEGVPAWETALVLPAGVTASYTSIAAELGQWR